MGQCSANGPSKPSIASKQIKALVDSAATDRRQFTSSVAELKSILASDKGAQDSKAAIQVIEDGIMDRSRTDQQRFWYLLVATS